MATGTIRSGESRTSFTRVSRGAAIEARRIEAATGKSISQLISEGKAKIVNGEIVYIKPTPKDYSIPSPGTQKFREISKEYEASLAIQKTTAPIKTKLSWLEQKKLEAKREQELREPIQLEDQMVKLKKRQEAPLPQWVTDFVGDPLKLSKRDRKIILPFYGKTSAEALKQKEATTSYLNYISKEIKTNPEKIALFAALPPALKIAGRGIQAAGITKLITKVPHGQLIARRTVQLVSTGIGVVYSKNVYDRVTEPVFTDYKDGKTTTIEKTLPNGDLEITTTTEQIPRFRKPTGPEQIERLSGIYATELAPMQISHKIINRGVKAGYKKPIEPKKKVKITTKINRAGKIIRATVKEKTFKEKQKLKEFIKSKEAEVTLTKKKAKPKQKQKLVQIKKVVETIDFSKLVRQKPIDVIDFSKMKKVELAKIKIPTTVAKITRSQLELKINSLSNMPKSLDAQMKVLSQANAGKIKLKPRVQEAIITDRKISTINLNKQITVLESKIIQNSKSINKIRSISKPTTKQRLKLKVLMGTILKQITKLKILYYQTAISKTIISQIQKNKQLTILIQKRVQKPKTKPKTVTKIIPKTKIVTKPKKKERPPPKKKIIKKPPIISPILVVPKKLDSKKKKKKKIKGKKLRYFIVKNPIPTFKDIYK